MGGFDVTPSELHAAGATLRRVRSELSDAMADFCRMAGTAAAALSQAVDLAGQNTEQAGTGYERAESANAAMAAGG